MTYLTYATHQQLTDDQASVSEYVRRNAATAGVSDPEQLTDLELTYRHRINTHLRGTGLVLVGDDIHDADTALARADAAMYATKRERKAAAR